MTITDKRLTLNNQRIEHEGQVWNIDGKYDPRTRTLKVYRVYGDVTKPALLMDALHETANALGCAQIIDVKDLHLPVEAFRAEAAGKKEN